MKSNQIDNLFQKGLAGMETPPPADAWKGISQEISGSEVSFFGKLGGLVGQPIVYNSILALVTLGTIGYFVFTGTPSNNQASVNTSTEQLEFTNPVAQDKEIEMPSAKANEATPEKPKKSFLGIKNKANQNDTVKVVLVDSPSHGLITYDMGLQSFNYQPNADFFGMDSFSFYKIFADGSKSIPNTIRLKIDPEIDLSP